VILAFDVHDLPAVNASLNALATVLLVAGYVLIKQRRETAHKWTMISAFGVSVVFLGCYLFYHYHAGSVRFTDPSPVRYVYYAILLSHVLLAFSVPVLAVVTIYLGLVDRRAAHRRWAWWAWPIWLYVSVTGVIIYLMLYHLWPSTEIGATMPGV
jgi:uncharacterized membrane protein YozB (DUF420 family)